MGYVENNLGKNETVVAQAKITPLYLIFAWVKAILLFWLLLIPVFKAIKLTISVLNMELAVTNKKIIAKAGFLDSGAAEAPLNKIQGCSVALPFWGKIFNYGWVTIKTNVDEFKFPAIANPEGFKKIVMNQVDQYEEDQAKRQAAEMAQAMAGVMGNANAANNG